MRGLREHFRHFWSICWARHCVCRSGFVLLAVLVTFLTGAVEAQTVALPLPGLVGAYRSSTDHPRVFTTPEELIELAGRIGVHNSYSSQRFGQLAGQISRDLVANEAWDATYNGCNIETYLYAFSYEPQGAAQAVRLQTDLHLGSASKPPAGGAVVASRLALYAALVKAGAPLPINAPDPGRAAALAGRILLAWAEHGFRAADGHFLSSARQFCGADGKINPESMTQVGLQVSRGVVYSVHAQDLLMYFGTLNAEAINHLNGFHAAMFDLVRNALNYRFAEHPDWECNHYSNHVGSQLTGLFSVARLLDDQARFEAVLSGKNPSIIVTLPWVVYFNNAIYGHADTLHACYANTGPDGLTSRPFFQTATPEPGEIDDRYRNENPLQGIGYAMATLTWIYDSAEILRIAGFNAYGYRGPHGQSIEMATRYYACFAKGAGFGNTIVPENAGNCPDFAQYKGKIVNGVEGNILRGNARFQYDPVITELEFSAKIAASTGAFSLDTIIFGHWRN